MELKSHNFILNLRCDITNVLDKENLADELVAGVITLFGMEKWNMNLMKSIEFFVILIKN